MLLNNDFYLLEKVYSLMSPDNNYIRLVNVAGRQYWNPLTKDDNSARLEAFFELHVTWMPAVQTVAVGKANREVVLPYGKDKQAARRRAGVLAVALMAINK